MRTWYVAIIGFDGREYSHAYFHCDSEDEVRAQLAMCGVQWYQMTEIVR